VEKETLDDLNLAPGFIRENITTAGISLNKLEKGRRIQIGSAIFAIASPCAPCRRMEELRPGLKEALQGRRGMLARFEKSGTIGVRDPLIVL